MKPNRNSDQDVVEDILKVAAKVLLATAFGFLTAFMIQLFSTSEVSNWFILPCIVLLSAIIGLAGSELLDR